MQSHVWVFGLATVLTVATVACKTAPSAEATPPPASPVSLLAGFDAPVDDDPVAVEAGTLANGPLHTLAEEVAAGMQLEGDLIAGKLGPGQVLEQEFRLQPGRCYTLVAVGGDGITDLGATFETIGPRRGQTTVLASDQEAGATAVVKGDGECYAVKVDAEPTTVRFVLRVSAGDGVVVSQLYAR